MMEQQIKLFLLILSLVYELRFVFEIVLKFFQENPTTLIIKEFEKIFLYFSIAYTITYFLI
jgi:hypothetical protein